jgi:hypothetical protein
VRGRDENLANLAEVVTRLNDARRHAIADDRLRTVMSSIMRRRGLISAIGNLLSEGLGCEKPMILSDRRRLRPPLNCRAKTVPPGRRRLQREQKLGRYVFMSERGAPMSAVAFRRMVTRLGPAAKMPFGIHPHMLRHSTGFKLANQGVDTRSLQHYLGHKNIQHTVRYSELSPDRFRDFWKD